MLSKENSVVVTSTCVGRLVTYVVGGLSADLPRGLGMSSTEGV